MFALLDAVVSFKQAGDTAHTLRMSNSSRRAMLYCACVTALALGVALCVSAQAEAQVTRPHDGVMGPGPFKISPALDLSASYSLNAPPVRTDAFDAYPVTTGPTGPRNTNSAIQALRTAQGPQTISDTQAGIPGVVDLARAWQLALQHDHTYQAAISEQAAAQTERAQGRAGLLPQVRAGYARSRILGDIEQPDRFGQRVSSDLKYDSTNAYVSVQQPLLNVGRYADYRRGVARASRGEAVFAVKQQQTGIRLATAYFNTLLSYDDLVLQRSLAQSLQGQADAQQARYQRNAGTQTDVQETQARLAVARAHVIVVQDELRVALRDLQSLLGAAPIRVGALDGEFPLQPPAPPDLGEWLERARVNNAEVRSARVAVEVAEAEVDRATSRYFPTLDLVASYGKAESENVSTLSQRSNTFVIGVQINIPIFTGGATTAEVSRTRLDRRRLQYELDAALERTQAEVTRQYTNVQSGAERIAALQVAVQSSELSLMSARKSYEYGLTSNTDVLRAQDTLYTAKYELVRARLEYLLAKLKLAAAVGDLQSSQFIAMNDAYLGRVIAPLGPLKNP